jgi:class 3 adenylate cyclase/tetratricopeptide (TPR) repeat protein
MVSGSVPNMGDKNEPLSLLSPYVPRCLLEMLARRGPSELLGLPYRKEGAFLFCDVSGFTPLSERLGGHGRAGTEELTLRLNAYFEVVITILSKWGGDVVKFGGDALSVFFERSAGEPATGPAHRAGACALEVLRAVSRRPAIETRWGPFPIGMKIGLSSGSCLLGLVGEPSARMDLIVAGSALDRMAQAEHQASPGECIVTANAGRSLGATAKIEPKGPGFGRLLSARGKLSPPKAAGAKARPAPSVRPFLLPAVWEQVLSGNEALLSEHRPVTTVFVGFSGLDYDEDSSLALLQEYSARLMRLTAEHGGAFNRIDMGDKGSKALVFFGAPEKHENDEERAVAFALALRKLEKEMPWLGGQRIGVSQGVTYCGVVGSPARKEYTVMGDAVNTAARLMSAAGDGGILATEEVRGATRGRFRWGPYRSLALKGKSAPLRASSPFGIRKDHGAGKSRSVPLVGRAGEIEGLRRLLSSVRKGSGALGVVTGEGGIGKSALLSAFLEACRRSGTRTAFSRGSSVALQPFEPWRHIFRSLLAEGSSFGRGDFGERWKTLLPDQEEFLCLGLQFLGLKAGLTPAARALEPRERLEKTEGLLARTLAAIARESPLAIALDDLDQTDGASVRLFDKLSSGTKKARILYLAAAKKAPPLRRKIREVRLAGLSAGEVEALALAALGAEHLQRDTSAFLAERSAGNPLFLLELVGSLKERGGLYVDDSKWARWKPKTAAHVPRNMEGLLLSRADCLPHRTRNLLKVASVLGASFHVGLLRKVLGPAFETAETARHVEALSDLGVKRDDGAGPAAYAFTHAALREAAYDSITVSHRRTLHAAAAKALERLHGKSGDPALLAHHFTRAENWKSALKYSLKAAHSAHARCAFAEALTLYRGAEECAKRTNARLATRDLLAFAECAMTAGENAKARDIVDGLLARPGRSARALEARLLSVRICDAVGDFAACTRQAEELEKAARKRRNTKMTLEAMRFRASGDFRIGRIQEAQQVVDRALILARRKGATHEIMLLQIVQAAVLFQRGSYRECTHIYGSALRTAEGERNYPAVARILTGMTNALREGGDLHESETAARRALHYADTSGSLLRVFFSVANLASTLVRSNRTQEALALLEEHRSDMEDSSNGYIKAGFLGQVGTLHFLVGNYRKALAHYRRSLSLAGDIRNTQGVAEATYNIGNTLAEMHKPKAALRHLRSALLAFRSLEDVAWFSTTTNEILLQLQKAGDPALKRRATREIRAIILKWAKPNLLRLLPADCE